MTVPTRAVSTPVGGSPGSRWGDPARERTGSAPPTLDFSRSDGLRSAFTRSNTLFRYLSKRYQPAGYETLDEIEATKGSTMLQTIINLVKCVIGAGSFALPMAFSQSGVWGGVIGTLILGLLTMHTIKTLAHCKEFLGPVVGPYATYASIVETCFGKSMAVIVDLAIAVSSVGACSAYVDFITTMMGQLDKSLTHIYVVLGLVVIQIPLALLRSFKYLSFTSVLGDLFFLLALFVILVYGPENTSVHSPFQETSDFSFFKFETLPGFFGKAAFLFCIHFLVLPLHSSMEKPEEFTTAVHISYFTVTVINVAFGAIGYMYWGDNVQDLVVSNLPSGPIVTIVKICLVLDLMFTFPIVLVAAREIIERLFLESSKGLRLDDEWKRNICRTVCVLLPAGLALAIPNFSNVVDLVSGISLSLMAIILPPLLHTRLFWDSLSRPKLVMNVLTAIFGFVAAVTTTYTGVRNLITN